MQFKEIISTLIYIIIINIIKLIKSIERCFKFALWWYNVILNLNCSVKVDFAFANGYISYAVHFIFSNVLTSDKLHASRKMP